MNQEKTTPVKHVSTNLPENIRGYWHACLSDEVIELLEACSSTYDARKRYDHNRLGKGTVREKIPTEEFLIATLKLARTQLRAQERAARGAWALTVLRNRARGIV